MAHRKPPPALLGTLFVLLAFGVGAYFAFSSVQGNYGVFRRIQIEAETEALRNERDRLMQEVAQLRNKTRRLSDDYLDLDLLDEQARDVLGLVRSDEVVLR
ncbi:MAG: septum formation initiator family protein [Rhodobacter sp.]|nr:septum formation initiator family protein [Rhodobacter sp.]MCY4168582.1 septum formation initiator family protein [Rhodobacter sp.]